MKTIFNTYIEVESQEQADRLKQICIDNGLPYWVNSSAFNFNQGTNNLDDENFEFKNSFAFHGSEFFVCLSVSEEDYKEDIILDYTQVTETEWIELLKQHNEKN